MRNAVYYFASSFAVGKLTAV